MDKQTDLKGVLLCLYVADPATLNSVLGTLFSTENSLLIQLWKKNNISENQCCKYDLFPVPKLQSAPLIKLYLIVYSLKNNEML